MQENTSEKVIFDKEVVFKKDVVFEKDVLVMGQMTIVDLVNQPIYKGKVLYTKFDLLKALFDFSKK